MMELNVDITRLNSFHIATRAAAFARFRSAAELQGLLESREVMPYRHRLMVLGGGSNILFTRPFDGLLLKNELGGIELVSEDDEHYYVRVGGGEHWHGFVLHCITQGWAGVENLSLIPGSVGASPIQNIGAYGVELKEVFHQLEAFHLQEHTMVTFSNQDCVFGYRDSVFKQRYKGQFAILSVTFRLHKKARLNTRYGAIEEELARMGVQEPDIAAVSQAVINIRRSKLPDPEQLGNAGSFFKNPVIPAALHETLRKEFPHIPGYANSQHEVKVPAAWLIEQCGWKGYKSNDAGVHHLQPLVLVNYGHASGDEILALSESIRQSVQQRFGILLETEVNIC